MSNCEKIYRKSCKKEFIFMFIISFLFLNLLCLQVLSFSSTFSNYISRHNTNEIGFILDFIGTCKFERNLILSHQHIGLVFVPQCTFNGFYKNQQCSPNVDQCWCVDTRTGEEIMNTRIKVGLNPMLFCDEL